MAPKKGFKMYKFQAYIQMGEEKRIYFQKESESLNIIKKYIQDNLKDNLNNWKSHRKYDCDNPETYNLILQKINNFEISKIKTRTLDYCDLIPINQEFGFPSTNTGIIIDSPDFCQCIYKITV